jgi:histone demethylase JARID1
LNLDRAPVYRPTAKEFEDPLKYIASIRAEAEPFGICQIVPPKEWKPPFAINKETFKFPTRIQNIHEMQHRNRAHAQRAFNEGYSAYGKTSGKMCKKPPVYSGREIDLYQMYSSVQRRGGYHQVTVTKKWREIAKILQVRSETTEISRSTMMSNI